MLPDRSEIELAATWLAKQTGALGRTAFTPVDVVARAAMRAALAAPALVLVAQDGRAIAWYGEHRPFVLHPTLEDLLSMHGLARGGLAIAA